MKSIKTRLNKGLGIDTDFFCMIHDSPDIENVLADVVGVEFDTALNTLLYYNKDEFSQSLKYMLFRTLK